MTTPPEEKVAIHGEGACNAAKAKALTGRRKSKSAGAEALRLTGARTLRWVPKDGAITMDFREDRINLHLDARGRIARIDCG